MIEEMKLFKSKYRIVECFTNELNFHYIIQERFLIFWWKTYYAGEFEFSSPSLYGAIRKLKQIIDARERKKKFRVVLHCNDIISVSGVEQKTDYEYRKMKPINEDLPSGQYLFYSDEKLLNSDKLPFWVSSYPNPNMPMKPTHYMELPEI